LGVTVAIELGVEHDGRRSRPVDTRARPPLELTLINGFELRRAGAPAALPFGAQRLIAFLALREHPVLRSQVAGTLWPEALDGQAGANLRSTLWRIRRSGCSAVEGTGGHIGLAPWVSVDLRETYALAHRVLDPAARTDVSTSAISRFERDLLPDWYEDWVQADRERFRQVRLHTLERLAERLAERGLFAGAIEAALSAISGEQLRESAHRTLIRIYLMEGNKGEAIRQYVLYQRLLSDELGIQPSAELQRLVGEFGPLH
jgi:DNA-binding SARP family transcriptional activator